MTSQTLTFSLAGYPVALGLAHSQRLAELQKRYAGFLTGPSEQTHWQLTATADDSPDARTPFPGRSFLRHRGSRTEFQLPFLRGWLDVDERQGWAHLRGDAERQQAGVDQWLAYLFLLALPRAGSGLLLHAAAVEMNGQGFVFFGPSGAGKTTVARLARGHFPVLCDEAVVLQAQGQGVAVHSTPFWGQSTPARLIQRRRRALPVAGLFQLEQAAHCAAQPLPTPQAILALLDTEKVATERTDSAEGWLAQAEAIATRTPVYRLAFAKSPALWDCLSAFL